MSSKAPTIRASRRATTRRAKKTRRGLRARARCCEFEVRQLAELKQHTPNVGGVQSHAATNHVQQVEHITKEPMNGAQPEHCKHHLLLHYHSTKPMRQTTTQSGWLKQEVPGWSTTTEPSWKCKTALTPRWIPPAAAATLAAAIRF